VRDAIPAFQEIFVPLSEILTGMSPTTAIIDDNKATSIDDKFDEASLYHFRNIVNSMRTYVDTTLTTLEMQSNTPSLIKLELIPFIQQSLGIFNGSL
jgi:hypothetical protein